MNQAEIAFLPPAHEILVDQLAERFKAELTNMAAQERYASEQRCRQMSAFLHRSIAQRRRFWRLRCLQERTA